MAEALQYPDSRTASVAGPIYLLLFPVAVVCFLAALVTDIAYSSERVPHVAALFASG